MLTDLSQLAVTFDPHTPRATGDSLDYVRSTGFDPKKIMKKKNICKKLEVEGYKTTNATFVFLIRF